MLNSTTATRSGWSRWSGAGEKPGTRFDMRWLPGMFGFILTRVKIESGGSREVRPGSVRSHEYHGERNMM